MVAQSTIRRFDDGQRQVATARHGPVLVTGGPGTGKTVALIGRIAGLLNVGISGRSIFFLTTSDRRAADMRRELPEHLGPLCPNVPAENMIGVQAASLEDFSASWLCRHGAEILGIPPDFNVWSHRQAVQVAAGLARADGRLRGISDREVRGILRWHWFHRSRLEANRDSSIPPLWQEILALYGEEKIRRNALARDELIPLAVKSMVQDPHRLEEWRQRSRRHLLVDDFQNVTPAGHRMLRMIGGPDPSITLAGDANQSVGSWRGADRRSIDQFRRDYPGAQAFVLTTNHRGTGRLAKLAVRLAQEWSMGPIGDESETSPYLLTPLRGEKPVLAEVSGGRGDMHAFVADDVRQQHSSGIPWEEMAILCRRHASVDELAPVFRSRGIPCTVMGDDRWQGIGAVQSGVSLATIYASQGMQWQDVWVLDVGDHLIPGRLGAGENGVLTTNEEQRLFFVAATRAAERLRFLYCRESGLASATRFLEPVMDLLEHRKAPTDT